METIKDRTRRFAINIIKFINTLPRNTTAFVITKQIIRSATSIGANYRSALRGRSKAEFISKLGIAEEEADETIYWLEILVESGIASGNAVEILLKEADEITSIIVSSLKTAKHKPR